MSPSVSCACADALNTLRDTNSRRRLPSPAVSQYPQPVYRSKFTPQPQSKGLIEKQEQIDSVDREVQKAIDADDFDRAEKLQGELNALAAMTSEELAQYKAPDRAAEGLKAAMDQKSSMTPLVRIFTLLAKGGTLVDKAAITRLINMMGQEGEMPDEAWKDMCSRHGVSPEVGLSESAFSKLISSRNSEKADFHDDLKSMITKLREAAEAEAMVQLIKVLT